MMTPRTLTANRLNAARSTGPRTDRGKGRSKLNAIAHGLRSDAPVIPGEELAEWETFHAAVVAELGAVGMPEADVAGRVALILWRQRRVARFEAATLTAPPEIEPLILEALSARGIEVTVYDFGGESLFRAGWGKHGTGCHVRTVGFLRSPSQPLIVSLPFRAIPLSPTAFAPSPRSPDMAFSSRWFLLSVLVLGPSHAAGLAAEPTKAEIAKATKPATALVDATPAFGSAFCVHENGLFLTNNHVVRLVPDSGTVKIVLNSGLKDEKKLTAKILRRDAKLDLALLQMEGTDKFPALQLGDDEKLGELDELIAFGFPFGTELAKPGENPAISVTTSSISALRRDQEKKLSRIQLDGALNPGNSGGPVVDRGGKVVGVVVSGIRGSGISLAIPVSHVRGFLEKPVIAVSIPPVLPAAKAKPVTITATVASVTDETDYDVELIATAAGGERKVAMKKDGRGYTASISLFADTPVKLRAEIAYPDGTVSVPVENLPYTAGAAKLTLAETKSIRFGESGEAALADNIKVAGPFTGLSEIPVKVGEQTVTFSTAAATSMTITAPPAANSFTVTVIARRKAMEVGRSETTAYLVGTERGGADALLKGKFIKPAKTAKPTTSLKVVSTSGDYIGGGKSYSYTEKELTARSNHGGGVSVNVQSGGGPGKGGDWWTLDVCAAKGERLVVGEYKNAMRFPFHDDKQPGLSFSGNGRGSNTLSGEFVVWELEMDGDKVIKAAIDFVQRGDGKGAPLVGVFRWNSSFE